MGIIAAGQITVVDLSDAPVLNTFITASRPTTQTYSKDSRTYKPSYASTPQVLTLKVTKAGSTANIIDSISSLHWFVVDGPIKTEITSKDNSANEYISGTHNEILTTKLDIDLNKGSKRYEVMGIWPDPSTGLDVQFGGYIDLLLTQNGATGPQGPQGNTGNGIANTVITYGLSMSDTTEPATWSSEMPTLVKGMYLWTRTVIIYTNGSSTTSYQISYIAKDADATAEIDKTKQELLEKLETVRDDSLAAVDEAKQQLVTVRDESLAAAEEAKQQVTTVANELSTAKQDFQNAVSAVDTKATNLQSDLTQAKQDLASQAQQLQEQAGAQSELTNRVSSVEKTANSTKTTVSELSKTVAQNGKDITSVTARTKVVEDDLAGTKTTLSQVQTTANSTSQKTATLETGLNGLSSKFENLSVGATNHFLDSAFETTIQKIGILQNGNVYTPSIDTTEKCDGYNTLKIVCEDSAGVDNPKITYRALAKLKTVQQGKLPDVVTISFWGKTDTKGMGLYTRLGYMGYVDSQNVTLTTDWKRYIVHVKTSSVASNEWTFKLSKAGTVWIAKPQFEFSAIASDYHSAEEDTSSKVAEYKQNADQNYASLQTTVQNLDGTVQHNKTVAEQTAEGFKTRIESLETYKSGESTRANQYFESAKTETARQLSVERTAIAKDYVAKSTYTSDVTGIRNELSATTATANTTKTNLANYQATNDRAVANLQSNIQTANGDISSLKTKVEAVPGQITSAVSSVESKIPKSVGGRNLALGTSVDWSAGLTSFNGQNNQTRTIYHIYNRGFKIGDKINIRLVLKYSDIAATEGQRALVMSQCCGNVTGWGSGQLDAGGSFYFDKSDGEIEFKGTTVVNENIIKNEYWDWNLRVDYVTSGKIQWKEAKAEVGDLPTPWSPAPEDTAEQISNLSSEIKQTADGITLLATKTELNNAKNELQSGINTATNKANNAQSTANTNAQTISTHTTQISALNTGLQAKVSQTEFNTLSGRVTTAENNITAKANELSSKITSVEGKIPTTSSGGRNLAQGTSKDWSKPFTGFSGIQNTTIGLYRVLTDGLVVGDTIKTRIVLKYTDIRPASGKTAEIWIHGAGNVTNWDSGAYPGGKNGGRRSLSGSGEIVFELTDKIIANHLKNDYWSMRFRTDWIASGSLQWRLAKVERGMFFTDWSPAPEDTATQISSLSSELKQTKDGITLLATKTELNTAKNELQSGINTATNKANNNAQTINTHTTQISALNTGLQAKVSQTEFNTLSGRVTNAENNITAKANELSSKITSVEGKIPTSVGGRNLWIQSKVTGGFVEETLPDNHITGQKKCYRISNNNEISFNIEPDFSTRLYRKVTFSAWVKYENVAQGANNWNVFNCFKHTLYYKNSSTGATTNADYLTLEGFTGTSGWKHITYTYDYSANKSYNQLKTSIRFNLESARSGTAWVTGIKIEIGSIPSDYSPAPEDTISQISSLSSELKQTKDGITLLATKTELNNAKNELQSGINTATNKANSAQSTANNAQNKANSNAQTISTHTSQISALNTGLQAKVSQSDFNTLSGRVTTAENNITAKANELSSKITKVEGKIPTSSGGRNLAQGTSKDWSNPYTRFSGAQNTCPSLYKVLTDGLVVGDTFKTRIVLKYTNIVPASGKTAEIWLQGAGNVTAWNSGAYPSGGGGRRSISGSGEIVFELTDKINSDHLRNAYWDCSFRTDWVASGSLQWKLAKAERGMFFTDWSPAPEDTINQINSVSSEFKQTTDSIKASVSSLDKSTIKSSSLTINSDGIVMKAGKSTTDVANAIGSYFSVNQNAIDLFADKIKVKGNMIVNGTITGDKIKASSVDVSKISGLDANFIKSKIEYAMVDWLKGKTIVADNGATKFDLMSGNINFNSDAPAIRRVTPGIPTQFIKFLKSDNTSVTTIGSNRDGSESSMNDSFAGIKIFSGNTIEQTEIISDQIYFLTGASSGNRRGWQMSTISGNDSRQITLVPTGNVTKSSIYASEHFIGGRNGWVNLRDFINYFNQCLGHLQNLTGRHDIFKPFEI